MLQFKLLMDLLMQYGVSLTLTGGLQERSWKEQWCFSLESLSSATHQLTMGLPKGSPLSPVLYNV